MNWDPRDKFLIQNMTKVLVIKAYAITEHILFSSVGFPPPPTPHKPHRTITHRKEFIKEK